MKKYATSLSEECLIITDLIKKEMAKPENKVVPKARDRGVSGEMPEIIRKLYDMGKVDCIPINGKYKPTAPIKDFIYWALDSKDDEDEIKKLKKELDENFFIKWIYYDVDHDTLKKYFRDERRWLENPKPQKQKPRKRTKTDKSGNNPV
ncbi:hypothetical protein AGMMS49944_30400 [Spirochaetia bacterium]|nr:hypothetical protein AGMMS49944_30400 [Spirochaetia bacterium]